MPDQAFHDLDALADGRAEMQQPFGQIALIQVVRPHAVLYQLMHQRFHNPRAVIDTGQQDGLIAQRDSRVSQFFQRLPRRCRDLPRVIKVRIEPDRMVLFEHFDQRIGDSVRQDDGHTGTDADNLQMLNAAQLGENPIEIVVREHQRVTAA